MYNLLRARDIGYVCMVVRRCVWSWFRLGYMCAMKEDKFRSNGGSAGPFMGMDWKSADGGTNGRDFLCAAWPFRVTLALLGG